MMAICYGDKFNWQIKHEFAKAGLMASSQILPPTFDEFIPKQPHFGFNTLAQFLTAHSASISALMLFASPQP